MNSGTIVLVIFLASVTLVAMVTLGLFRFMSLKFGLKQVHEDGVALTKNGLEVLRIFGLGKMRLNYADVESVELLPSYKGPLATLLLRYRMSARWIGTRLFGQIVVIKLKGPRLFKYLLATPKEASAFVQQLRSRIEPARIQ